MAEHELPLVSLVEVYQFAPVGESTSERTAEVTRELQRDAGQLVVNSLEAKIKELKGMLLTNKEFNHYDIWVGVHLSGCDICESVKSKLKLQAESKGC